MQDASLTELRARAKYFFDLVESGKVVRVLRNGKPIAEIHPIPRDLPSWKQRPARPLVIGGPTVSSLILKDRGD